MPQTLVSIYRRYESRNQFLLELFQDSLTTNSSKYELGASVRRQARLQLVVRMLHLWSEFTRQVILRSVMGRVTTGNGQRLPRLSPRKRESFSKKLLGSLQGGSGTKWDDPSYALGQANAFQIGNYHSVSTGLGTADLSLIKPVRNFIVHPNQITHGKFIRALVDHGLRTTIPDDLIQERQNDGITLFESWVRHLSLAARSVVD